MNKRDVGNKLVSLRGNRTQKEVAADLKISISALAMYERGNRIPRDEIKLKIASYYGKSVQEIFFSSQCHEKGRNKASEKGGCDEEDKEVRKSSGHKDEFEKLNKRQGLYSSCNSKKS